MKLSAKIYVAGHQGLVGSALLRKLIALGYSNIIVRSHQDLNLTNQGAVKEFFEAERPEYVLLAAARVGGILANSRYPAKFIYDNLLIQAHVIEASHQATVKRLLVLGSSCIYPKYARQPIREEYLLDGPLEPTNRPYAIAKISGVELCWSYNRQYGTKFLVAMPTNLYGPGDHYDLQDSHVLPALMRKMHEAKLSGADHVVIWGTGEPRREFLHSNDAADACIFLMNLPDSKIDALTNNEHVAPIVNVGCGKDLTVRELAEDIATVTGFKKKMIFDTSKPDGTPRKVLDVSRLANLGWRYRIPLTDGLAQTYEDFLQHHLLSNTVPIKTC